MKFKTKEEYLKFREAFKGLAQKKQLYSASYYLIRNFMMDKDPKNGFSPITRPTKLQNGHKAYEKLSESFRNASRLSGYWHELGIDPERLPELMASLKADVEYYND